MRTVVIEQPSQRIPPMLKPPKQRIVDMKPDKQVQLERKMNVSSEKTERIARQSLEKVFEQLQKVFKNTQYNVRMHLDELGGNEQVKLTQRTSGKTIVEIPPDVAVQVAERAKVSTVGLFLDYTA